MGMTHELKNSIKGFVWPREAPTALDDALAFLQGNPLPRERYLLASGPAKPEILAATESRLGRPLPAVLRAFLERHDGIEENWVGSGPILASAKKLVRQDKDFRRELRAAEEGMEDVPPDLASLFAIGYRSGHQHFVLDTSRSSETGDFPVSKLDAESGTLRPVFRSLGHYIAWIVCDAHTDPQGMPPSAMIKLFPVMFGRKERRKKSA